LQLRFAARSTTSRVVPSLRAPQKGNKQASGDKTVEPLPGVAGLPPPPAPPDAPPPKPG
jgi:hypothetical protein